MAMAFVSRTGGGLVVQLPDEITLREGEVEVTQDGDDVVLKPKAARGDMARLLDALDAIPIEVFDTAGEIRRRDRDRTP